MRKSKGVSGIEALKFKNCWGACSSLNKQTRRGHYGQHWNVKNSGLEHGGILEDNLFKLCYNSKEKERRSLEMRKIKNWVVGCYMGICTDVESLKVRTTEIGTKENFKPLVTF
jgi:hypothetical protein